MHFFTALRSQQGFIKDLHRETRTHNPHAITCPTLIVHSRFDGSVPLEHARHNARDIPAAELLVIDVETQLALTRVKRNRGSDGADNKRYKR